MVWETWTGEVTSGGQDSSVLYILYSCVTVQYSAVIYEQPYIETHWAWNVLEMEILCNFQKLMSSPETFRDDSIGPKESPKKIGGPNDGAKEPGPIF